MTKVTYAGPCRHINPNVTATFGIFKILTEFLTHFIVFENSQIRSKWWRVFKVRLGRNYCFLTCFSFTKPKMTEIASNFRISLDLFELVTFGTNYGLQTANETVTRCPNVTLWYFGQIFTNLAFQYTPDTIVQRIGIRRFLWPLCAGNKRGTSFCNHSWAVRAECDEAESC